jgi:hypothetical protein
MILACRTVHGARRAVGGAAANSAAHCANDMFPLTWRGWGPAVLNVSHVIAV